MNWDAIEDKGKTWMNSVVFRTPLAKEQIAKDAIYGVSVEQSIRVAQNHGKIHLFYKITAYIEGTALDIEGLYRLSGSLVIVQQLKQQFDIEKDVDFSAHHIHDITGALKLWLGELPEPLFTYNLYPTWLEIEKLDTESKVVNAKSLITILPPDTQNVIAKLLSHLHTIAAHSEVNKMTAKNLAIVFAPTILSPPLGVPLSVTIADLPKTTSLVIFLIEHQEEILQKTQVFVSC